MMNDYRDEPLLHPTMMVAVHLNFSAFKGMLGTDDDCSPLITQILPKEAEEAVTLSIQHYGKVYEAAGLILNGQPQTLYDAIVVDAALHMLLRDMASLTGEPRITMANRIFDTLNNQKYKPESVIYFTRNLIKLIGKDEFSKLNSAKPFIRKYMALLPDA